MNIAVRYYSRTGNTKQIAELIAAAAGCRAEEIEVPLEGKTDILFLGGGIYWGKIPQAMKEYMKSLASGHIRRIAVFATAEEGFNACKYYQAYLKDLDMKVYQECFLCQDKQVASEKKAEEAAEFAYKVLVKTAGELNEIQDRRQE